MSFIRHLRQIVLDGKPAFEGRPDKYNVTLVVIDGQTRYMDRAGALHDDKTSARLAVLPPYLRRDGDSFVGLVTGDVYPLNPAFPLESRNHAVQCEYPHFQRRNKIAPQRQFYSINGRKRKPEAA